MMPAARCLILGKIPIQPGGDHGQGSQLQSPIENSAKALRLPSPTNGEASELLWVGLFCKGRYRKQGYRAGNRPPESTIGIVEGQRTAVEERKEPAAGMHSNQLVGHKYGRKDRADQYRSQSPRRGNSFAQNTEDNCRRYRQFEIEADRL